MSSNDAAPVVAALARDFMTAASSGNVDGMMTTYASDAVLMPPNAPPQRGAAAIRQFWSGFVASGKVDLKLTDDNVLQSGNLATEAGRYDVTITPQGGAPIHDNGKYVLTWQKRNGEWKAVYDIFNSDLPAPQGR